MEYNEFPYNIYSTKGKIPMRYGLLMVILEGEKKVHNATFLTSLETKKIEDLPLSLRYQVSL